MPPPFKLEAYRAKFDDKVSNRRIIYAKGSYGPKVKISDYECRLQSRPFDTDAFDASDGDRGAAHYRRLGTAAPCFCYATTYSDMTGQLGSKRDYVDANPRRVMMTYYGFKNDIDCGKPEMNKLATICADDYMTETHSKFSMPYPYKIKRFGIPTIPWLTNRKFKRDDPMRSGIYADLGFGDEVKMLQCHKGGRDVSYDFCKHAYQDGSHPPQPVARCHQLDY